MTYSESFVPTDETSASIPLVGPTAEYVSSLQRTIGQLQMQVATLSRSESATSVHTKSPPPAYEERSAVTGPQRRVRSSSRVLKSL